MNLPTFSCLVSVQAVYTDMKKESAKESEIPQQTIASIPP
jgi:hypothetical protein